MVSVSHEIKPAYFVKVDWRKDSVLQVRPVDAFPAVFQVRFFREKHIVEVVVAAFASYDARDWNSFHSDVSFVVGVEQFLEVVE